MHCKDYIKINHRFLRFVFNFHSLQLCLFISFENRWKYLLQTSSSISPEQMSWILCRLTPITNLLGTCGNSWYGYRPGYPLIYYPGTDQPDALQTLHLSRSCLESGGAAWCGHRLGYPWIYSPGTNQPDALPALPSSGTYPGTGYATWCDHHPRYPRTLSCGTY